MDNLEHNLNLIKKHRHYCFFHGKKRLVQKLYFDHFGKPLNFNSPLSFNEKINLRKLSKQPLFVQCADKYNVRSYVKEKIGEEYLIPQYFYKKHITIKDLEKLPNSFVIKTTSGSGANIIVKDKSRADLSEICQKMNSYTKIKYGYLWGEFFYNQINNCIIAEKLLTKDIIYDYKIHCFRDNKKNLRQIIQIMWGPKNDRHKVIYDANWRPLSYNYAIPSDKQVFHKPKQLKKLLELASKLSSDFNYVRVDLFVIHNHIYFGELTFTPAAGFGKFSPMCYDLTWGNWIGDH